MKRIGHVFGQVTAFQSLCAVLEPVFERRYIHDSYACRNNNPSSRHNSIGFRLAAARQEAPECA